MKTWERRLSHVSTALVAASGLAYFWMKYGLVTDDPFSVVNHPWQPAMLNLHLLSAPLLVFAAGVMIRSHILKKLHSGDRRNRGSGLTSALALPAMIFSGYGLQVLTSPRLTRAVLIVHLGSSSIFFVSYLAHQVIHLRLGRGSDSRRERLDPARGRA